MVANRTREMRLSGMTRGAYGNVNHGQGLNGHVPRKRRNSQASGLKLRAPYLYPDRGLGRYSPIRAGGRATWQAVAEANQ
jgi:predicted MPP superfamily phosphohydrolase